MLWWLLDEPGGDEVRLQALTAERAKAMTAVEPEVDLQHRVLQNAAILQQTESS